MDPEERNLRPLRGLAEVPEERNLRTRLRGGA
jgi:hypothetical protein